MKTKTKPFLEADAWPKGKLSLFKSAHKQSSLLHNHYNVPCRRLLQYCFELLAEDSPYVFSLYCYYGEDGARYNRLPSLDSSVIYDEDLRVLLFIQIIDTEREKELKHSESLDNIYRLADEEMRGMFALILKQEEYPLPKLFGFSFIDASFRVYCYDKETCKISPPSDARPPTESDWIEISSEDGFKEMKRVVKYVRDIVEG